MSLPGFRVIALCAAAAIAIATGSPAQDAPAPPAQADVSGTPLTGDQLDQLVAPVALYPDPLLADVLTAATYPLEVVEADRWIAEPDNGSLNGDALTTALGAEDWDPSVKSLVPFPDVLQMMDAHLDWMESLGEAFLAQPDDVMNAVQRMRRRAQNAGDLNSPADETVSSQDDSIVISPPSSDVIYVPQYDPWCAFGAWPYPPAAPYYFSPWPGDCAPADDFVSFDAGIAWPFMFWDWGYFDWRDHQLRIHRDRYDRFHPGREPKDNVWKHDPARRDGVPYTDPRNSVRFEPRADDHQSFRGYGGGTGGVAAAPQPGHAALPDDRHGFVESPERERAVAPAFEEFDSGPAVRMESQRGMISRQGGSGGFGRGFGGHAPGGGGPPRRGH
ncbi:MAG TPA: DUF3300 domain-containing protein [Rhizomicrobium sp.]|jgi:hypothetical protein|nr:DUF3300 domain-containing protein [Rhizomicrobium sp.]